MNAVEEGWDGKQQSEAYPVHRGRPFLHIRVTAIEQLQSGTHGRNYPNPVSYHIGNVLYLEEDSEISKISSTDSLIPTSVGVYARPGSARLFFQWTRLRELETLQIRHHNHSCL